MPDLSAPVVRTRSLFLRHFTLDDAAPSVPLSQEQGIRLWMPDQVYADEAQALEALRFLISQYEPPSDPATKPYVLAVCLAATGELIGHVGFSACSYGVEIGYAIADAHQNRGYAKQAVLAATSWAHTTFDLPLVHAVVAVDNVASCRVLESCGYQLLSTIQRKLHGVERAVRIYGSSGWIRDARST